MIILGIESSCDDTSAALVDAIAPTTPAPRRDVGEGPSSGRRGKFIVLAEKTASQIEVHKKYGGVVPEIAGRLHAEQILPVVEATMEGQARPDAIAVTSGPGLITGLIVGVEAAKALAYLWDVPVVGVNHIEGHIHSVELGETPSCLPLQGGGYFKEDQKNFALQNFSGLRSRFPLLVGEGYGVRSQDGRGSGWGLTNRIEFPALCLIVSGGHTELILMADHGEYQKIGKTRDDAAGECFDKVGKLLGFDYPGGPKISRMAMEGNPAAIDFPRPMLDSGDYDFSFAGLKTSALYWLRDNKLMSDPNLFVIPTDSEPRRGGVEESFIDTVSKDFSTPPSLPLGRSDSARNDKMSRITINDFCASFEQAIVDTLVAKTLRAAEEYRPKTIILAGGVAANQKLRQTLTQVLGTRYLVLCTPPAYCMDNAAMIAVAGYYHLAKGETTPWRAIQADPQWELP